MRELEKELTEISDVFVDLHKLTQEQGVVLKEAQTNVESANINVHDGVGELNKVWKKNENE